MSHSPLHVSQVSHGAVRIIECPGQKHTDNMQFNVIHIIGRNKV